nr:hypothetical protein [Tanacetum cinerariifolium]
MISLHPDRYHAGNLNNNNMWLEEDDYLLGELEAIANEPMVVPAIEEVAEPVAEAKEEQDLAALFGEDDDLSDDDSEGVKEEEVWEVNKEWLMASITPPSVPAMQPSSVYEVRVIEDLSTRLGNLEYGHGQLVKKLIQVSDAEVAADVSIEEIGLRVGAQVEQGQQTATQRDEMIGFAGRGAAERRSDLAATDYGLGDEQP